MDLKKTLDTNSKDAILMISQKENMMSIKQYNVDVCWSDDEGVEHFDSFTSEHNLPLWYHNVMTKQCNDAEIESFWGHIYDAIPEYADATNGSIVYVQ